MDVNRALRNAVSTGGVYLGTSQAMKALENGEAKIIVLASNCPSKNELETAAGDKGVKVYKFDGRSTELGPACGKPFSVSVISVLEPGESEVLQLKNEA
ncbi:MAG: 50S ribosomal protein L30e [Thermoplasmata archaeon HGW-Thermoplasmata-1]|nr:MAG: 50S ribosomal protein L30e [Thermoplasmata archaeon HGW-Thermoplasmata-1]